ncbi:MAG: hypothetical protein ABF649_00775 [Bacillus sp. (in: firmicutes)]
MQPNATCTYTFKPGHHDLLKMVARDKRLDGNGSLSVSNGILKCKSNSITERAYVFWNTYLPLGGWMEVQFVAKAVSGSGNVSGDVYEENDFVVEGDIDPISSNVDITGDWKPYRFIIQGGMSNRYARLVFGLWKSVVGEVWFRNINIKVYNSNIVPEQRFAVIKGYKNNWYLDDKVGRFGNQGVSSVEVEDDRLVVTIAGPRTWGMPVMTAHLQHRNNPGYRAEVYTWDSFTQCRIYIVNKDGNVVSPTSIQEELTISFMAYAR